MQLKIHVWAMPSTQITRTDIFFYHHIGHFIYRPWTLWIHSGLAGWHFKFLDAFKSQFFAPKTCLWSTRYIMNTFWFKKFRKNWNFLKKLAKFPIIWDSMNKWPPMTKSDVKGIIFIPNHQKSYQNDPPWIYFHIKEKKIQVFFSKLPKNKFEIQPFSYAYFY